MHRANRLVGHLTGNFVDDVKQAPPDAIFGIKAMFAKDKDPRKINLSVGAYRTDEGKPLVLKCVKEAERKMLTDTKLNKEYLPQRGDDEFSALARKMLIGDAACLKEGRVATVQSLSGTGALRLGAEFTRRFVKGADVYISNPTWGTHKSILSHAGLTFKTYRYWDKNTKGLDFKGMVEDIQAAPDRSIMLLHSVAHNPTGVDLTQDQWRQLSTLIKAKRHVCWFDSAYQGFASGDLDKDAFAVRYFLAQGHDIMISQSFAKNFGLYGERAGTFSVVCGDKSVVPRVISQLNIIIRNLYSNPPKHGAEIIKTILKDPQLTALWKKELLAMSERINQMRVALRGNLIKIGTPGNWDHITSQIGMFSFTGLGPKQCDALMKQHHVYLLTNGRISMAGVNTKNVAYLANAIKQVVTTVKE